MLFSSILFASAMSAFASAQATIETSSAASVAAASTVSQSMPPAATEGFNPGNVTSAEKFNWCLGQRNQCPQICGGAASQNTCDSVTLTYTCVCPNGTVPDSSAYSQTLPFFICEANFGQCIANHPNDAQAQGTCQDNHQCGTRNATAEAIALTSTASSTITAAATSGTGAAASGSSTTASGNGAAAANSYTSGAFAMVLMAAFKFLL